MGDSDTFLGLSRGLQLAIVAAIGGVLVFLGLAGSSSVDPQYNPLAFGTGFVMVVYAAVVGGWDWWQNRG